MGHRVLQEITRLQTRLGTPEDQAGSWDILQILLEKTVDLVNADRGALILFDHEAEVVTHFLRQGEGWEKVMTTLGYEELSEGLSGWSLRTGEVAVSPKGTPDPRESPAAQSRRIDTGCGSILVAPLGGLGLGLGTITTIRRPEQPDFTADDVEVLGVLARFAAEAVALHQAREAAFLARAEAKSAIRSKLNFLSNLSHELRTPLNGILGFSHLLELSSLDKDQKLMVSTIAQSGDRLLETVDNILELAQFEAGVIHIEAVAFAPRSVLDAVQTKHAETARNKNLTWTVDHSPDLPPVLNGDPIRLGQAWGHILSNAVKFTKAGGVTVFLDSRRKADGLVELVLSVNDTGIGFPASGSTQWFMPFHQEDGTLTRKFGGTGLGLALCDRIARAMGGGLSVRGEPGSGTQVRVWVELCEEGLPAPNRTSLRVLLFDSDPLSRLALVKMLEKDSHRVDVATAEKDLPGLLASAEYEVVLVDGDLSDPGTLDELTALARQKGARLVGLFAFGSSPPAGTPPWAALVTKPVSYHRLRAALKECLLKEIP